jgi:hypothetical protein
MQDDPLRVISFVASDQLGKSDIIDVKRNKKGYSFQTENGQPVMRIRHGYYRITGSGVELASDDPEAV